MLSNKHSWDVLHLHQEGLQSITDSHVLTPHHFLPLCRVEWSLRHLLRPAGQTSLHRLPHLPLLTDLDREPLAPPAEQVPQLHLLALLPRISFLVRSYFEF